MRNHIAQATDIAEAVLCIAKRRGIRIDSLKLQKLLYFAQALSLVRNNKRIFRNLILAWKHGPVVRSVYNQYKHSGKKHLHCSHEAIVDSLTKKDVQVIEDTLETFKNYTGGQLTDITHKHRPWKDVFEEDKNKQITPKRLKEYYTHVLE